MGSSHSGLFSAQFLYPPSPDVTKSTQNRAGVEGRVSVSSISMEVALVGKTEENFKLELWGRKNDPF